MVKKNDFSPEDIHRMRLDPILAAKVILDMDFPPHERIRITGRKMADGTRQGGLWRTKWFMDYSGRDTAKSHNNAVVAVLKSCLFPNRMTIILSHKFTVVEEGYFLRHFQKWNDEKPIFAEQVKKIIRRPDRIKCKFHNGSEILGIPPGLMRECVSIRGDRCNDLFLDEWVHYPNQTLISDVILPIATRENEWLKFYSKDDEIYPVVQNHIIFTSTPQYTYEESYTRVKYFYNKKKENPMSYDVQTWNYLDIPENWDWIVDREIFDDAKANLPESIFKMEWMGEWCEAGAEFYNPQHIKAIRELGNNVKIKFNGDKDKYYVFGIDVAGPEGRSDFTICIIEIELKSDIDKVVCLIRKSKVDIDEASGMVHKENDRFFPSIIVCDPGGGGRFLGKKLGKKKQVINNEEIDCMPILEANVWGEGKSILYFFSAHTEVIKKNFGEFDDEIINKAHNLLQSTIEKKQIFLPSELLETTLGIEDEILNNCDLACKELMGIQLLKDRGGSPAKTARGYYTFKGHKDSAYALLYAKVAAFLFRKLHEKQDENTNEDNYVTMSVMEEEERS